MLLQQLIAEKQQEYTNSLKIELENLKKMQDNMAIPSHEAVKSVNIAQTLLSSIKSNGENKSSSDIPNSTLFNLKIYLI